MSSVAQHNGHPGGSVKRNQRPLKRLRSKDARDARVFSGEEVTTASMADVKKIIGSISWLMPWIPNAMLTGLIGPSKECKSYFALDAIVRPVITGSDWFDGTSGPKEPGYALWCSTENSAAIDVDRIEKCGLPFDRIKVPFEDDPLRPINLNDEAHQQRVEDIINQYGVKVVVVDSFRGSHDSDENSSLIVKPLQALGCIAERTKAAIVVIHHTRKLKLDEEISADSGRGSGAYLAMMRSQLAVHRPDAKSDWRRVQVLGENLGIRPKPVGILPTDTGLKFGTAPQKPHKETEQDRAAKWLKANMQPGEWCKAAQLEEEAEQDGLSEKTLRLARQGLGIVKPKHLRKTGDGWEWMLPGKTATKKGAKNGDALTPCRLKKERKKKKKSHT